MIIRKCVGHKSSRHGGPLVAVCSCDSVLLGSPGKGWSKIQRLGIKLSKLGILAICKETVEE